MRILGLSTQRGALPVAQKQPTIDITFFTGESSFSIYLRDGTFFDEHCSELKQCDIEKIKTHFMFYDGGGEPEYNIVKSALNLCTP